MTPGTYLRVRREAARVTIDDAATRLASLPMARGHSFAARVDLLKRALLRIEGNVDVLSPEHADLVRQAFPFDPFIYQCLAATGRSPLRICGTCGCSDTDPCMLDGEPACATSPGRSDLCSICAALSPGFFTPARGAAHQPESRSHHHG